MHIYFALTLHLKRGEKQRCIMSFLDLKVFLIIVSFEYAYL
jgi:hypothetical protein